MMVATIIGILCAFYLVWTTYLGSPKLSNTGPANTHFSGLLCVWVFSLNIRLNMLPSDYFMPCLDFLLEYSTSESQALQLIVHVVFGAFD